MDVRLPTPGFSRWNQLVKEDKRMLTRPRFTGIGLARSNPLFADRELRAHASGAVELAFDHHNGDVIMKTNVAAEVCRAVKDIDRQLFCRK